MEMNRAAELFDADILLSSEASSDAEDDKQEAKRHQKTEEKKESKEAVEGDSKVEQEGKPETKNILKADNTDKATLKSEGLNKDSELGDIQGGPVLNKSIDSK